MTLKKHLDELPLWFQFEIIRSNMIVSFSFIRYRRLFIPLAFMAMAIHRIPGSGNLWDAVEMEHLTSNLIGNSGH